MRTRIWSEMTEAKFKSNFIVLYLKFQRTVITYSNVLLLVFSSSGIFGWKVWDYMPLLSCVLIAVISLFKLIKQEIVYSEKQILKLEKVNEFYSEYYNKLERLWYEFEGKRVNEVQATQAFYQIKNTEIGIDRVVNEVVKYNIKKFIDKAKRTSDNYFTNTFR
ncbi:MAG: hypothetical protein AB9842_08100 [Bacteroidales bacterium]